MSEWFSSRNVPPGPIYDVPADVAEALKKIPGREMEALVRTCREAGELLYREGHAGTIEQATAETVWDEFAVDHPMSVAARAVVRKAYHDLESRAS